MKFLRSIGSIGGIALALIGLLPLAYANDAGILSKYRSMPGDIAMALDVRQAKIVLDGHSILRVSVCPPNSPYVCMNGDGGIFVFPKRKIVTGDTWSFEGYTFRASKELQVRMLGKTVSAHLIEQQGALNRTGTFIRLNRDWWLSVAVVEVSATPTTFIIEGECGFGAPPTCPKELSR